MTHVETNWTPQFRLEFSRDEVDLMVRCTKAHYDYTCEQLEKNGFINGLRNSFEVGFEKAQWRFSSRDIDLLCKVLEVASNMSAEIAKQAHYLTRCLQQVLRTQP